MFCSVPMNSRDAHLEQIPHAYFKIVFELMANAWITIPEIAMFIMNAHSSVNGEAMIL